MSKGSNQKLKLSYLTKIMLAKTDDEHALTMPQIIEELEKYDVTAERKSIYSDFADMTDKLGIEIIKEQIGRETYYHVGAREFELAEVKLLIDAIQSSKFITQTKSRELITKIKCFVSEHQAKQLQRQVYINDRVKTMNESVYYNVDFIHTAINQNKKIRFKYFKWDISKKLVPRHNGDWFVASPWALTWDDENYYCLAFDEKHPGKVTHYRVDKMENVTLLEEPRLPLPEGIDIKKYGARVFGMYACENIYVRLRATNDLVGVFYDRFGTDIGVCDNGDGTFTTHFETYAGPPLIGWLMQFGARIEVISPDSLRKSVEEQARQITELYSKRG